MKRVGVNLLRVFLLVLQSYLSIYEINLTATSKVKNPSITVLKIHLTGVKIILLQNDGEEYPEHRQQETTRHWLKAG